MKDGNSGRGLSLLGVSVLSAIGLLVVSLSQAAPGKKAPNLHKEVDLRAELTGRNLNRMSDEKLYVEVLTNYQAQDRMGMKRALDVLLAKHRHSPHTDNALYLMGYSALEQRAFAEALRHFEFLLKHYPTSNKAVAAEFAKGVAYKHMKFPELAQRSFLKVRKKYPGSPESFRAESELKLLVKR